MCASVWATRIYIGLLVFVIISTIMTGFKRTSLMDCIFVSKTTNLTVLHQKQHPGCPIFDSQVTPKRLFPSFFSILNDSVWLTAPTLYSPSFQALHAVLFGATAPNLYQVWPNYFRKKLDRTYPHTFLTEAYFTTILKQINVPVTFVVEAGSFMGGSVTNMAKVLLRNKSNLTPVLLCIDTWLGGLEHWTNSKWRQMMSIAYGRPIVYEQFIANIIANNLTNYVIPYSTTSILGARFLLLNKFFPQIVYLDSAHLEGETYVELEMYWLLLQVGGVLIGDDWNWTSVRCDVLRFVDSNKVNVTILENIWFIKKTKSL